MESNDLTNMISALSSNPEIMQKISSLAKGINNSEKTEDNKTENAVIPDKKSEERRNRERLISALKPYLNPERRAKADKLLSLLSLIELSKDSALFANKGTSIN